MANELQNNLVYLSENLTNILPVLLLLFEKGILTNDEKERIMSHTTTIDRNYNLLNTLQRKGWSDVKSVFVEILKQTSNVHCALKIEQNNSSDSNNSPLKKLKGPLSEKWWPEEKYLMKSFHARLSGKKLLIEQLESMILDSESGMTVISQKVTVSGLGGVGKTTTAKWFANHFSKKYDYIVWIDCGEGSLLKSFQKLARDLKVPDRSELELSELAQKSFSSLKEFKCLWIFDNAECYVGEQGIRDVLPKNQNYHTIITSKNCQWGHDNGDGKIVSLQLETFTLEESVAFLQQNLKNTKNENDNELLEHLSISLGNLPLALQIAIATLNENNISLTEYIKRVRKTDDILHSSFDDYEKTINKTMKISLSVIQNHEGLSGKLAHQMLLTLGFIKPDFVEVNFVSQVEGKTIVEINAAGDLLVKYSLITRTDYVTRDHHQIYFHCHRLLQQVIRHNTVQEYKRATLEKILKCDDYLDYKLIPFTFADEYVKMKYPEIKAQLIDQMELQNMTVQRRFQEAVDLALIIHMDMRSSSSHYNYATCLERNGERQESIAILEDLYKEVEEGEIISYDANQHGIMDLMRKPTKGLIAGQLYLSYWRTKDMQQTEQIFRKQKNLIFKTSVSNFRDLVNSFASIPTHSYFLNYNGLQEFFFLKELFCSEEDMYEKRFELQYCSIYAHTTKFPRDLKFLNVNLLTAIESNGTIIEYVDMSCVINSSLKYLYSSTPYKTKTIAYSLDSLRNLDFLELHTGNEIILTGNCKFSPRSVKLVNCTFTGCSEKVEKVNVNSFIDFQKIVSLELRSTKETTMILEMKEPLRVDSVALLGKIEVLNWDVAQWSVHTFKMVCMPFVNKSKLSITELELTDSPTVDLAVIPHQVERLTLDSLGEINCTEIIETSNLKYIQLKDANLQCLPYFSRCHYISHLLLESENVSMTLKFSELPKSVKKLKLTKFINEITLIEDLAISLDTLVLQGYSLEDLETMISSFSQHSIAHLVLESRRELTGDCMERVVSVVEKLKVMNCFENLTIGEWKFEPGEFNLFECVKYVDKEAGFFVFEKQKGLAIEKFEFKKLVNFSYHSVKWDLNLLKSEQKRLDTFTGWKANLFSPEVCAKAGFFHVQRMHEIVCVFCEKEKLLFEPNNSLDDEHAHFEYCPLLLGLDCRNIPCNVHCALKLEHRPLFFITATPQSPLISKWWPEEKTISEPFCENTAFITKLYKMLSETSTPIISLSGLPGVGKSTAAIWFAQEYKYSYHHIIWIDCQLMEESVHELARCLANELSSDSFTISECIQICFEKLKSYKCLWIYDNAEYYEEIGGIADQLWKENTNCSLIIVSRKRLYDNQVVPTNFVLQGCGEKEAVEFINENVKILSKGQTNLIRHLCQLLGYLPLALQMANNDLKSKDTGLMNYIDKIRTTDSIILDKFHLRQESLYTSVEIQYMYLREDCKKKKIDTDYASSILSCIAYTTPYNIPIRFFESMKKKAREEIIDGIDILNKYSFTEINEQNDSVSINPLVQQAIRHMKKEKKNESIRTLLNCEGFIDFKLIPFCFADRNLQKEYKNIKAELITKIDLKNLFQSKRFEEAVKLSRLQYDSKPSVLSMYNYALCLVYNHEIWEAKILFKHLYKQSLFPTIAIFNYPRVLSIEDETHNFGVVQSTEKIYRELIAGHLFRILLCETNTQKAGKILEKSAVIFECHNLSVEAISEFLTANPKCLFQFDGAKNRACLTLSSENGSYELSNSSLNENFISKHLSELKLDTVKTSLRFSRLISQSQLKKLTLTNMKFYFINAPTFDEVYLKKVKILNWICSQWKIKTLTLEDVPFVKTTKMKIKELRVLNSEVDVDVLPDSITKLYVNQSNVRTVVKCSPLLLRLKSFHEECCFISCTFVKNNGYHLKNFNISRSIKTVAPNLKKLILDCSDKKCGAKCTQLYINLNSLISIPEVYLQSCTVILSPCVFIRPEVLSLRKINFLNINKQEIDVVVNEFVNFDKVTKLTLENAAVDLTGNVSVNEVRLQSVRVVDWKDARWKIKTLILINIPFVEQNLLHIEDILFEGNKIDISCLQHKSLRKLTIKNSCYCWVTNTKHEKFDLHEVTIDGGSIDVHDSEIMQNNQKFINFLLSNSKIQKLNINEVSFPIPLDLLKEIPCLNFWRCKIHKTSLNRITPEDITLINVQILLKNGKITNWVNKIVDFCKMKRICLVGMYFEVPKNGFSIPDSQIYPNESDFQNSLKMRKCCTTFFQSHELSILHITAPHKSTIGGIEDVIPIISCEADLKKKLNIWEPLEVDHTPANKKAKLDKTESATTHNDETTNDFSVSAMGTLKIRNILQQYPESEADWEMAVPIALEITQKSKGELQKLDCCFGNRILKTLALWRQEKRKKATFNTFLAVIKEATGNKEAEEHLEHNREEIRLTCKNIL